MQLHSHIGGCIQILCKFVHLNARNFLMTFARLRSNSLMQTASIPIHNRHADAIHVLRHFSSFFCVMYKNNCSRGIYRSSRSVNVHMVLPLFMISYLSLTGELHYIDRATTAFQLFIAAAAAAPDFGKRK